RLLPFGVSETATPPLFSKKTYCEPTGDAIGQPVSARQALRHQKVLAAGHAIGRPDPSLVTNRHESFQFDTNWLRTSRPGTANLPVPNHTMREVFEPLTACFK